MIGVSCIVAFAFAGWTCVTPCNVGFIIGATVGFIGSCPAGLIAVSSGVKPPSEVSGVAGVACPRADVGLALISYRTCPNPGGGMVVVVSDSTLVWSSLFSAYTALFSASRT
ncbi:hypothetical protein ACOSQ2_020829 [Xanthoceras sorbifolium]